jgi:hypothetical protein
MQSMAADVDERARRRIAARTAPCADDLIERTGREKNDQRSGKDSDSHRVLEVRLKPDATY